MRNDVKTSSLTLNREHDCFRSRSRSEACRPFSVNGTAFKFQFLFLSLTTTSVSSNTCFSFHTRMTSTPSPLQLWLSSRPTRSIDFDKPVVHGLGSASEISFDGHLTYEVHKMNNLMTQGGIKVSQVELSRLRS